MIPISNAKREIHIKAQFVAFTTDQLRAINELCVKQYFSRTGADEKRTTKESQNPITKNSITRYIDVMSIGGCITKQKKLKYQKIEKSMRVYIGGQKTGIELNECHRWVPLIRCSV